MSEPQRTRQTVAGLLLLCFLLYFWELGNIPFYNYEESKEALVVWEMVNGGGWILPQRNGSEMPLKPPLFHWIGAVVAVVSGKVNEFAVRSPSALAATGAVLVTFFFARALWDWRTGLLAALILATSPEWVRWAVTARSDMVMVFFLTAALVTFFSLWQEQADKRRTVYLFYCSVGFATLAKGPLGFILPGLVILVFLAAEGALYFLRRMRLLEGALIVSGIAVSWYLLAFWQGGEEFFRRQILDENVFRFFESEHGGPSRDHSWFYYLPTLCLGMLPWSLFFPALAHFLYLFRAELRDRKLFFPAVWCVTGLVFFSLASGKRSNYLLPLYPAVALLLGRWWKELVDGTLAFSPLMKRVARAYALVIGAAFVAIVFFLVAHGAGFDLDHLISPFLHPRDRANLPLVAEALQSQFPIVLVWLALLALAMGWYLWGLRREQWMYVFAALTVSISSSLYFANALFHPVLAQVRTYKPFMRGVRSTVKNAPLYFYKDTYDYGAIFYADRRIPSYKGDLAALPVEENSNSPLYLLMYEEDWKELSASSTLRLEHLVTSEGKGPDKNRRLVLVALLHGNGKDKEKEGQ
ncbi:MAG: glycosyltransferase family 39 protein [Thermodesulfobacteriota bacterium]|jgi:4-amino-4-deoxy-L-arabinose transferase-like glycosyltransferase